MYASGTSSSSREGKAQSERQGGPAAADRGGKAAARHTKGSSSAAETPSWPSSVRPTLPCSLANKHAQPISSSASNPAADKAAYITEKLTSHL
jgi:hypothetical protein